MTTLTLRDTDRDGDGDGETCFSTALFGCMQSAGASQTHITHLRTVLEPMRFTLQEQEYLGGVSLSYADFAAAGVFAVGLHSLSAHVQYACDVYVITCISHKG